MGDQSFWVSALQYLLQSLYGKGLGHSLFRDLGGLGGTTDQELIAQRSRPECIIWSEARNRRVDADLADRAISLSPLWSGDDVGKMSKPDRKSRLPNSAGGEG